MTVDPQVRHGLGDPRIPWVVLLEVALSTPPGLDRLRGALDELAARAGWPAPSPTAVVGGERHGLLGALATDSADGVRVGVHDGGVLLAARHDLLDGLAMLVVAGDLLGYELHSSARGTGPGRPQSTTALLGRAWEVAIRPTARVATSGRSSAAGDTFAETLVVRPPRTADLVYAGARAVATWNRTHHVRARRVSVAVGVSTVGGSSRLLEDRSGFLRLRGVESLSHDQIRDLLAQAPLQPGGGGSTGAGLVGRLALLATRVAASRLGSTLLVSHLGEVAAPDEVRALAFYPVTGGGSGLSLGAATVGAHTTLTLRGRAAQHDDEGLQGLLALVVEELEKTPAQRA